MPDSPSIVVVESPAKAKTIGKYLGPDYTVVPSYGHVRDLEENDAAVEPDKDFAMHWALQDRGKKALASIKAGLGKAQHLYLATDPDREGEAIAWHIRELLEEGKKLKNIEVKRVVFNEVTKKAVLEAMSHPRDLDQELIDAYRARRALDFLVGYTLSPVLWRRMPGSRSAGRVQSVALRLVCERETEIERFRPREYWTVDAELRTPAGQPFTARLTQLDGRKLDKFDLPDQAAASAAVAKIEAGQFSVGAIERKRVKRHPLPPFTTSTLQQEASRKLGFGATRTMRLAQQLYEGVDVGGESVGLITYMRTDSVTLSGEAVQATRALIASRFGQPYLPESPRLYKTQAKNAQEAHEAIRPTELGRSPDQIERQLDPDLVRLYDLIWRRTVACEMESAVFDQVSVDAVDAGGAATLRATGSTLVFDGFLKLYREDRDDPAEDDEESRLLPAMSEADPLQRGTVAPAQHFTQPPPRFTEASLVKRLEELGIGRPSTYASILQVLQDRSYVRLEKRRFIPEDLGRMVTAFLTSFFDAYFQYDFTAQMENLLDEISGGRAKWQQVMRNFWLAFSRTPPEAQTPHGVKQAVETIVGALGTIRDVIEAVDAQLGPHFFPDDGSGRDARACPACAEGRLGIKFSRNGAFIGCSNYPDCRYTRRLAVATGEEDALAEGPKALGVDPADGEQITLRKGPFGIYLQRGEAAPGAKPKRVSVPRDVDPETLDLDLALKLLALPRVVGAHPESGKPILAGLGRFGPYVNHDGNFRSLESTADLLSLGLNRAVDLLAQPNRRRSAAPATPQRVLGEHPADGKPVTVGVGRFGPFVKHGSTYANLPKGRAPDEVTLDEGLSLIEERLARQAAGGGGGRKKKGNGAATAKAAKAAKPKKAAATPRPRKSAKSATAGEEPTEGSDDSA